MVVWFSVRVENQPRWWLGAGRFYLLPVGVLTCFVIESLDGEDSFQFRGFPFSPPGQAKWCLFIKIQCRKHKQIRRLKIHSR